MDRDVNQDYLARSYITGTIAISNNFATDN